MLQFSTGLFQKALITAVSVLETAIETILGVALFFGIWQRIVAWCSAGLLLSFALTMSVALGAVAPLSYSVFTAFGGAFLLGAIAAPASRGLSAAYSTIRRKISGTTRKLRFAQTFEGLVLHAMRLMVLLG
jgi:hypothetical protein